MSADGDATASAVNNAKRVLPVFLTVVVLVVAGVAGAILWWLFAPSSAERTARRDVRALSGAIAEYVAQDGLLPRVSVRPGKSGSGDMIWGPDFLVESRIVPRAEPESARLFFVVGNPGRWCVEAQYIPPTLFSVSSGDWVLVKGERGETGDVASGRCGNDYALELSPVSDPGPPDSARDISGASAPVGTCLASPFANNPEDAPAASPALIEVVACGSEHYGEVFLAGQASETDIGDYEAAVVESCEVGFEAFVGVPRNISALVWEPFFVDATAWEYGDRVFACFLFLPSEDYALVGSARDSRR